MASYENNSRTAAVSLLTVSTTRNALQAGLTAQTVRWDTLYNWHLFDFVRRDFTGDRGDYYTWSRPRYRHCFRTP